MLDQFKRKPVTSAPDWMPRMVERGDGVKFSSGKARKKVRHYDNKQSRKTGVDVLNDIESPSITVGVGFTKLEGKKKPTKKRFQIT